MTRIYLDYAATTPLDPHVAKAMHEAQEHTGNPNSIHQEGQIMRGFIDQARNDIAEVFSCTQEQIVFTPSATAANNLVLQGVVQRFKKLFPNITPEIIISPLEHASVYEVARALERDEEIILTILSVDTNGQISPRKLVEQISARTALVSVQWVNNETGIIQPTQEIIKVLHEYRAKHQTVYPFFHTDAVQGIGHVSLSEIQGSDFITISAHKLYGPTGVGVLVMLQNPLLDTLVQGGGQENGWWSGTESTDRIVGCAEAIKQILKNQDKETEHLKQLHTYTKEQLQKHIPHIQFYGSDEYTSPHIVSLYLPGVVRPDIALDLEGIAVSSGAACSQQSVSPSRVLQALGASITQAQESLRISFGKQTTKKEIDVLVEKLKLIIENSQKK
ncbi:MAG: cysteine desulfurase [Patescibacteria group bacterium]|nr:cysteine desulfurase [Patescibacteria group bacterium]